MADAASRRNDLDVAKGLAGPLEESKTLVVALRLELLVLLARVLFACDVRDHRMVNNERAGDVRVHARGVSTAGDHGVAHGGKVDKDGHAGEVLEEDARGHELDLGALLAGEARLYHSLGLTHGVFVCGRAANDVLEKLDQGAGQTAGARDARDVKGKGVLSARRDTDGMASSENGVPKLPGAWRSFCE